MTESILFLLKALGEILGGLMILYLLLYLLGVYTVVYRVLPSGQRRRVGYLWRLGGEYILYDSLLPIFESSKIGFIKGYDVRPLVLNAQQNMVQKTLGTYTDDGKVFDEQGSLVATCEDMNARRTAVLEPSGDKVGYLCGSLRAKADLTVRAAGFAVLREAGKEDGAAEFDVRVGALDLMLPAALIYTMLFYPLLLLTESFANVNLGLYMLVMLLYYILFVGILYVIKYKATIHNDSINRFVGLVDRNVGVKWMNVLIVLSAVAALRIAPTSLMPLFMVLLTGFACNMACFKRNWHLEEPSANWTGRIPAIPIPQKPSNAPTSKTHTQTFSWAPVMALKGIKDCKEELELTFAESDFSGINSFVRKANPFRAGAITSDKDLRNRAMEVLAGIRTADGCEETAIAKILNSAYQLCLKYGLADFEIFDLVLGFVQANIKYVTDEESDSIGNVREYFRYACETLCDREGDCDCKSVLAYRLFERLGINVKLVTVKSGEEGVYNHVAIVLHNTSASPIKLPPEFAEFAPGQGVYCESTGHGFRPGDVPKDVDAKSLIVIE